MKLKKRITSVIVLLCLFNLLFSSSAFAFDKLDKKITEKEIKGSFFLSGKLGNIKSPNDAVNFMNGRQKSLKLTTGDELNFKLKRVWKDNFNKNHIRLQQYYKGLPIFGKEVIVHTDSSGNVFALNGSSADALNINTTPSITAEKAIEIAKNKVNAPKETKQLKSLKLESMNLKVGPKESAELTVYPWENSNYLCYVVDLSYTTPKPLSWKVFVDAQTGNVINKYDKAEDFTKVNGYGYGYFGDKKSLKLLRFDDGIYDLIEKTNSSTSLDDNFIATCDYNRLSTSDPFYPDADGIYNTKYQSIGVDAHYYSDIVYNYFKTKLGRNSWDGYGAPIFNITYLPEDNAFWDPDAEAFYFGTGDGTTTAPYSSGLDVIAHEFTHAVTDSEVSFNYQGQSGALSESYSDAFACLIDPDWQIGEDIVTPGVPGDALRDMSNPRLYGDPDNMKDYIYTSEDNGGVHANAGIPNKAFYNIASKIGRDDAGKIYYRSLMYLTSSATFQDARNALLYSAKELYGVNSTQYNAVRQGWAAVGVTGPYELSLGSNTVTLAQDSPPYTVNAFILNDDGSKISVDPNNITWTTSNSNVATVSQGVITPVGKGTAVITATYGQFSATVTVTVTPVIQQIQVDKPTISLTVGGSSVSVKATAVYSDGSKADVTKLASWSSSNPSVAAIQSPGVVKGVAKGDAIITVMYGGKGLEIPAKVIAPVKNLTLDKAACSLTTGDTVILTPTVYYTDGSSENVSGYTQWSSSNTKVATVSTDGKVTAVGKGKATIIAKFGAKSAKVTVEVTPPVNRIEVSKPTVSLVIGGSKVSLKVKAYYVDGSNADVTRYATWAISSGGSAIASVSQGTLTGIARGETTLLVSYKDKTVEIPVVVTPKVLSLISDKSALDLTVGDAATNLKLTAKYSDGSEEDVTAKAVWTSSKTAVARVDKGAVTPVAKGTTNVSAEFNGKKVSIKVAVTTPVDRLVIDKSNLSMIKGSSNRLTVKAYYVDNSSATLLNNPAVTWSSSNSGVVTVNSGALKAVGNGEASITVNYKGKSAVAAVRVRPALTSITGPGKLDIHLGELETANIYAVYVDGSKEDVTGLCQYTVSNSKVITVSNGYIVPVGVGTSNLYVKYNGKSFTIKVTVSEPLVTSQYAVVTGFAVVNGDDAVKLLLPDGTKKTIMYTDASVSDFVYNNGAAPEERGIRKGDFIKYELNSNNEIGNVQILATAGKYYSETANLADLQIESIVNAVATDSSSSSIVAYGEDGVTNTYTINSETKIFEIYDTDNIRLFSSVDEGSTVVILDTNDDNKSANFIVVVDDNAQW